MDEAYHARFLERSAYETARTAPPRDFPALPDIPIGRYTDPGFYELERSELFGRTWLYAVHDSELTQDGAFKLCDVAGTPVLMIRGEDSEVRAFHNACRHRGAPVVRGESGVTRRMTCQYHSWSYDLQGALQVVPEERDFVGLCREDRGLVPIRAERWGGWWFVNLDSQARPLLEMLDPLPELLGDVARSPLRVFDTKSVELDCNWKILAEAFLEVYHARTIHPKTVAPTLDTRGTVISLFDHGHQNMISPVRARTRTDNRDRLDELAHVPPMFRHGVQPAHGIFPNIITPMDKHGFPFMTFTPTAIDRTRLDITWFAPEWGDGPLPEPDIWKLRLDRFDVLMEEDYLNLKPMQASMDAAAHGGQVVNYQERRIWHVHAWIDKTIGPDRIDDALRVEDLLAEWVETP